MFASKTSFALFLAAIAPLALGRELIVERDGRAIIPRRFGQEQCGGLPSEIGSACRGEVCGVLGGRSIGTLLAASPECAQQDLADEIIDASKNEDAATAAKMVELAIRFRQCEKNTPPDFTTNPPTNRGSVFCQKAPKNAQLNGLVQAQDPANDPNLFFDPVTKTTVTLGSQANTVPFGGAAAPAPPPPAEDDQEEEVEQPPQDGGDVPDDCPPPTTVTVTVTAGAPEATEAPVEDDAPEQDNGNGNGGIFVFPGTLGGVRIPSVTANGDGSFAVENNANFNNLASALVRACDVQNNQCANAANASGNREFTVGDCNAQQAQCIEQSRASV